MMTTRTTRRMLLIASVICVSSACYTYTPVEQPMPGAQVRAALTVEGSVRQSEFLGEPIRSLSGRFVSSDANAVQLDIVTASSRGTFNDIVLRDTLAIPAAQIVVMEEREISWLRTAVVFAAAATVGVVAISSLTNGGEDVDTSGGPPPVTFDRIRIPIFRFGR